MRGRSHGGLGCNFARRGRRGVLCAAVSLVAVLASPVAGYGDTAPIGATGSLPWSDPGHASALELLASRIATHIAGRAVAIRCDGDGEWGSVVAQAGGDPAGESGFVATQWNGSTGQLLSLSTTAELSSEICLPLQQFAGTTPKPTKCLVRNAGLLASTRAGATRKATRPALVPCYLGNGKTAARKPQSYWEAYNLDAIAILTLAHESIHLGGVVGGSLSNGLAVGDPQAEAKADCFGMQWMPYVAMELGDTPDDAQAIARYAWDKVYPLSLPTHPEYWSPDCRPGGALDERPSGATASWP